MGVFGTFCCVCALPVQHDHYIPSAGGMLKIYRGGMPGGGHTWEADEHPFPFGPEHAWVAQAVALSLRDPGLIVRGSVTDGDLRTESGESHFVGEKDEFRVLHAACWDRAGKPKAGEVPVVGWTHAWATLTPYHEQLFDIDQLAQDGKGWMLVDPSGTSPEAARSRARIDRFLVAARRPLLGREAQTVQEVLAQDRPWRSGFIRDEQGQVKNRVRFRSDLSPTLNYADYPALVWFTKEYAPVENEQPDPPTLDQLETFEAGLKDAVEANDEAIFVAMTIGGHRAQYVIYAKDEARTRSRIDALPGREGPKETGYDNARDPEWGRFFELLKWE